MPEFRTDGTVLLSDYFPTKLSPRWGFPYINSIGLKPNPTYKLNNFYCPLT
jgi:hypothetical protein